MHSQDKETKKWKCESCTLLNPLQVEQCIACTAWIPKEPHIVEETNLEHDEGDAISPTSPTQNGTSINDAIEIMDQEVNGHDDDEQSQWKCRRCTLLNPLTASRCQICETPKTDNVPTTLKKDAITSPTSRLSSSSASDPMLWKCVHCHADKNSSESCDRCSEPKTTSNQRKHSSSSELTRRDAKKIKGAKPCPKCNTDNPRNAEFCTSCKYRFTPYDLRKLMEKERLQRASHTKTPTSTVSSPPSSSGSATPAKPSTSKESTDWACKKCTYLNTASQNACDMCQSKREVRLPSEDDITQTMDEGAREKQWECNTCTTKNPVMVTKCTVCDTIRAQGE